MLEMHQVIYTSAHRRPSVGELERHVGLAAGGGALAPSEKVVVGATPVSVSPSTLPELLVPPPPAVRLRRQRRHDQRQRYGDCPPLMKEFMLNGISFYEF